MADSDAFQATAEALEHSSDLDRLEARGTLRIAIKAAGLEARTIGARELAVVLDRVLPDELRSRGIENADAVIESLKAALPKDEGESASDSPESVFRRLGGDA